MYGSHHHLRIVPIKHHIMSINIATLTRHPERLGKDTLYELRSLLARYPYYQPARLLLLKNLYLLHDPTFDEELRRAAVYVTERQRLFDLIESPHYQLRDEQAAEHETAKQKAAKQEAAKHEAAEHESSEEDAPAGDRTAALIDSFLDQLPREENEETQSQPQDQPVVKRKPTPADATIDYVAYLMEAGDEAPQETPQLKGQELIDDFINKENGKISLQEETEYEPEEETVEDEGSSYFTETLARIYIKQGRYSKALEIIQRLYLEYPKKNRYFADQIRFLQKLILNEQ